MTGQIPDEFLYMGEPYSLIGIQGTGLYSPQDFGIYPRAATTACWRGFVMKYDCTGGRLVLDTMHVNADQSPEINGVMPSPGEWGFKHLYEGLGLKTKFTGSMLLGKDFIDSMYVHMGFQRPIAYRTVLEIQVQDGDIIAVNDLSSKMEELRERDPSRGAEPDSRNEDDVISWIQDTFSLDYDLD